jgi:ATP-dependent helicase YprA (DUF1998 family)
VNVFELRQNVVDDYHRYIASFLNIRDRRIRATVDAELDEGLLWPPPLVQLNPAYEMGASVTDLVKEGLLHPDCGRIFVSKGKPFSLYRHQEQAIRVALRGEPYVVTTGTGSGKSLTYFVPIVDRILRTPDEAHRTRAIIVYPMNALINSQDKAIQALLDNLGPDQQRVVCRSYTGQLGADAKAELQANPPHILLTNYVMLELMMSRPKEHVFLDRTMANLEFLVLDELHTHTGRQGADVAMLVRRVRERCGNANLQCAGTSATMVTGGDRLEQMEAVAHVAGKVFGVTVSPANVIDETLRPATSGREVPSDELKKAIDEDVLPDNAGSFCDYPLAIWAERQFGLESLGGDLRRHRPISVEAAARTLAEESGCDEARCHTRIRDVLLHGAGLKSEDAPVFAIKLHQFISQGDSVYATLENPSVRHITLNGQYWAQSDDGGTLPLAPLAFCRVCGQEYYQVVRNKDEPRFEPRPAGTLSDTQDEVQTDGYVCFDDEDGAPLWTPEQEADLPSNWLRETKGGSVIKREYVQHLPERVFVRGDGSYTNEEVGGGEPAWFIASPLLLCPRCGSVYDKRTKEFTKLARLSSEGRSTATTVLSLSTIEQMKAAQDLDPSARKLLSFTDNRQDASLQAGHFNDFVNVARVRSAIYHALPEPPGFLDYANVANEVVETLALRQEEYAINPGGATQEGRNRDALTEYIRYRVYFDLRRGWRVIQPNLEQCGLLRMEYDRLDEACRDDALWTAHDLLASTPADGRMDVCRALLDHLRRSLAVDADCLKPSRRDILRTRVTQALKEPWTFDEGEDPASATWYSTSRQKGEFGLGSGSLLGRFLKSRRTWPGQSRDLSKQQYEELLRALVQVLETAGYLHVERDCDDFRMQVQSTALRWSRGDGTPFDDPIRNPRVWTTGGTTQANQTNQYFIWLYTGLARRAINRGTS